MQSDLDQYDDAKSWDSDRFDPDTPRWCQQCDERLVSESADGSSIAGVCLTCEHRVVIWMAV